MCYSSNSRKGTKRQADYDSSDRVVRLSSQLQTGIPQSVKKAKMEVPQTPAIWTTQSRQNPSVLPVRLPIAQSSNVVPQPSQSRPLLHRGHSLSLGTFRWDMLSDDSLCGDEPNPTATIDPGNQTLGKSDQIFHQGER